VEDKVMTINNLSEAAKAVVRRNTEDVQGGISRSSRNSSPTIFSTTRRSRGARLIRMVRDNSTKSSGPRSPTFTPTSIGSLPMVTA
jgi:hypothetical protein